MNTFMTSKWCSSILLNKKIVFGSHHFKSSFRLSDSFAVLKTSFHVRWRHLLNLNLRDSSTLKFSRIFANFLFFLTWEYSSISNSVYREYYSNKTHRSLRERRYLGVKLGFSYATRITTTLFHFFFSIKAKSHQTMQTFVLNFPTNLWHF